MIRVFGGNGTEKDLGSPAEARNIVRGLPKSNRGGHEYVSAAATGSVGRIWPGFPSDFAGKPPIAGPGPPRRPPAPQSRRCHAWRIPQSRSTSLAKVKSRIGRLQGRGEADGAGR